MRIFIMTLLTCLPVVGLAQTATPPAANSRSTTTTRPQATRPQTARPATATPRPAATRPPRATTTPRATAPRAATPRATTTPHVTPRTAAPRTRPAAAAAGAGAAAAGAAIVAPPTPPVPEQPAEPQKGSATGQPIPRFAALRSDEVNMRVGPGTRYPVDWVYRRKDMPVEILREFEVWRLIRDPEGNQGWVHTAVLTGRRTFVIRDQQNQPLRRRADAESSEVATLRPGVIGRIRGCEPGTEWCQVQVGSYRGYLPRSSFWGTYQGEEITN